MGPGWYRSLAASRPNVGAASLSAANHQPTASEGGSARADGGQGLGRSEPGAACESHGKPGGIVASPHGADDDDSPDSVNLAQTAL